MNFYYLRRNKPLGIFLIILGLTILILAAGELLVRIMIALGALMLINHGMRLTGMQPAHHMIMHTWFRQFR